MSEEQIRDFRTVLEDILAELRRLNEREDQRDDRDSAMRNRFKNL